MNFPIKTSELLSHYFYNDEDYRDEFLNTSDDHQDSRENFDEEYCNNSEEDEDRAYFVTEIEKLKQSSTPRKQKKQQVENTQVKIKTRFLELPPEILLNIIDFVVPFFSTLEQVLKGQVFDDESKRDTNAVLQKVIQRMEPFFLYAINLDKTYAKLIPSYGGLTFNYTRSLARSEDVMLRQNMELIVKEIFNYLKVSKESFYKILITDCYHITTVKLFWDFLYHSLRNPYIVNEIIKFGVASLPGHQYVLAIPIYQAVQQATFEPVCFAHWFLMSPCFGVKNYLKFQGVGISSYQDEFIVLSNLSMDEWKRFLSFLRKQVKRYPCISEKREYIELIIRKVVDTVKILRSPGYSNSMAKKATVVVRPGDDKVIFKKVEYLISTFFLELNIPLLRHCTMTMNLYLEMVSFSSSQLFMRLLKRNVMDNSQLSQNQKSSYLFELLLENMEIFTASLKHFQFDIIDIILDFYERYAMNHQDIVKFLRNYYPIHTIISAVFLSLERMDMNKSFYSILTQCCKYITTIRKCFLKLSNNEHDVLKGAPTESSSQVENVMFTLVYEACNYLPLSRYREQIWIIFKYIYLTLIKEQGCTELIEDVKNSSGNNILEQAISTFEVFEYLLSKDQPKEILTIYQKLLYSTRYDVSTDRYCSLFNFLLEHSISKKRLLNHIIQGTISNEILLKMRKLKSYYHNEKLCRQLLKQSKLSLTLKSHSFSQESKSTYHALLNLFSEWGCEE
ncbi:hypothetical protein C9374_000351 [Naegleria lovaniensis]|uniref:Uncharacterized protein n=1 Tax=Naegleria lovaniensis TaxID=51637 RepID=A0AA88GU35_NAELO|nr:uncharacterized protein C9374_000351 [Naegleria lovaniensis]KAG2388912.1 hypothetical protein C9374_000351 [Naegleria lovaniensis]